MGEIYPFQDAGLEGVEHAGVDDGVGEGLVHLGPAPFMWCCYSIQQTDKTSLGLQAIFGLRDDPRLGGKQYIWLTTVCYITYICGEYASTFLLQRWALGRTLSIYMLCWVTPQAPLLRYSL